MESEEKRTRNVLIKYARRGMPISCKKILEEAKLSYNMGIPYDRGCLGKLLGNIVKNEYIEGRPLLSSILAVSDLDGNSGFYAITEDLGIAKFRNKQERELFVINEFKKTVAYWKNNQSIE